MKLIQLAKGGLFIVECFRIILLVFHLISYGNRYGLTAEIVFIAPSVLFLLMALFILLDTEKHKSYINLFISGKCLSIFILLGWLILTARVTIIESFVLSSDLLSIAFIILIIRDSNKIEEINDAKCQSDTMALCEEDTREDK